MKIVLAMEGMDGSGKSSLAHFLQKLCEEQGQRFTPVGRREIHAGPLVGKLTRLLQEEVRTLTPPADIFIRIAREYQRAHLAAAAPTGVVLLDRFVLSVLALARLNGLDVYPILSILKEITVRAHLHATVLVQCPFDIARGRVKDRNNPVSARKDCDERLLRKLADFMVEDFQRGMLTGQQWPVDNSQTLEIAQEQLAGYLLPYLRDG